MNHEELFDKFLQRTLTREESAQLKALLKDNPEAGRSFVEHVGETSLLIRVGSQLPPAPERLAAEVVATPLPSLMARLTRVNWKWAAAAVFGVATLATAGWFAFRPAPEFHATVIATSGDVRIVRDVASIAAEPGLPLRQGDILRVDPRRAASSRSTEKPHAWNCKGRPGQVHLLARANGSNYQRRSKPPLPRNPKIVR
jgi:hypothetical protein